MPDTPLHLTTMAVALASGPAAVGALAGVGCFLGVGLLAVLCQVPFVKVIGRTVGFIDRCVLLIALGFGSGRLHPAPGTWGSIVGVGWLLALACSMSMWIFGIGCALGIAASVWHCGRAERILGTHDPSCVVIDEIAAVPLAWIGVLWMDIHWHRAPVSPVDPAFWHRWPELILAFVTFRVFDIWKPGWIGKSQRLHGGLGVTADDVLAGLLAAVPVGLLYWLRH